MQKHSTSICVLIITACLLILIPERAKAQILHGNADVWGLVLTHVDVSPRVRLGNELHLRRNKLVEDQKQWIVRPFIEYKLSDVVFPAVGYSYLETSPYGDFPLAITKPEHNVWEQITIKQKINNTALAHRFRLEHRFQRQIIQTSVAHSELGDLDFSNRFRYRFIFKHFFTEKNVRPCFLTKYGSKPITIFNFPNFDRNWFYAGLGQKWGKGFSGQIAYLHQYTRSFANRIRAQPHRAVHVCNTI